MKITVQLDLSQMFASEFVETSGSGHEIEFTGDSSFMEAMRDSIKADAVRQVLDLWRKSAATEFEKQVKDAVESMKDGFFAATMQSLLSDFKIKKSGYGNEMVSLRDYTNEVLAKEFDARKIDEKVSAAIRALANEMATSMKDRYDMLFASQLVAKMNEINMLREDVAKALLPATA